MILGKKERGDHTRGAPVSARPGVVACCLLCAMGPGAGAARGGDFADAVAAYVPAPGQFINSPQFNNPARALGAPVGGGTASPENSKLVSLGGFGGSITLRFSVPVEDDPANPFGLDCIVFGNASWVSGNPNRRFAEAGVIEISRDANGNGAPDDAWYVVTGSHLPVPAGVAMQGQMWDSSTGTATPPANVGWYPGVTYYPGWPGLYTTVGFRLPSVFETMVVVNPNGTAATLEGMFGYADCTPTMVLGDTDGDNVVDAPGMIAGEFYTTPDNPFVVGVTAGSGGGDGFDIAWARDPVSGAPARLDSFDFLRVSSGVNFVAGPLGELSTEVGGAARVRAKPGFFDMNGDGVADAEDLYRWHAAGGTDFTGESVIDSADSAMLQRCVRRGEAADMGVAR